MQGTRQQLLRVEPVPGKQLDPAMWPGNLAPVRDLVAWGNFASATIFVGDNGVGKSTIVETLAVLCGFPIHGGSRHEQREAAYHDAVLADYLHAVKGTASNVGGFFLRAETMHNFTEYLSAVGSPRGHQLQQRSHGEAFGDLLAGADKKPGLWILDEPESALSFQGQLNLLSLLMRRVGEGQQVIMSTHSPLLASLPDADLVEVTEAGLTRRPYDDLAMVDDWRRFLDSPERYLRHLRD